MIKSILIDVDDTLLDFEKCSEEAMRLAMTEVGIVYREGMMDIFHPVNNSLWKRIEQGNLTVSELYQIRWNLVFEAMGIQHDGVAFEKRFLHFLHDSAVPVDGAEELLKYLHGKYKLYVASNAPNEQQRKRLLKASMLEYFESIFASESLGVSKPQKEFFRLCLEGMGGALTEETAIIGDSLSSDIKGGADSGLFTCWFNRKGKSAPSDMKIDVTVTTLADLKNIL